MPGFTREELKSYARGKRAEFEGVLEKIVEIPSVSVEPGRKADVRRAAEYAVSLLESFGAKAKLYETKGHPDRLRPLRPRPELSDGHRLQPPRRAAGRRPRLEDRPLRLHPRGRHVLAARHDRRQGPGADGALRRRATRSSSGVAAQHPLPLGARGGDRQPALRGRDPAPTRRSSRPTPSSCPTRSGSRAPARPARPACAACRASASSSRPGETDQHSGTDRRRGAQPVAELAELIAEMRRRQDRQGSRSRASTTTSSPPTKKELEDLKSCGLHRQGLQAGPPLPARSASTTPLDVMKRIWLMPTFEVHGIAGGYQGPGVKTDHSARGDGDRLVPARARR